MVVADLKIKFMKKTSRPFADCHRPF